MELSSVCSQVISSGAQSETTKVFNNAEESLQDGSHLYSTQHETASTSVWVTSLRLHSLVSCVSYIV